MEKIKKNFIELVQESAEDTYLGIGDYENAEILFVGKEGSNENKSEKEVSFAKDWTDFLKGETPPRYRYRNDFKGGATWKKYQALHNVIFPEHRNSASDEINFLERIFATEMNSSFCKDTAKAQKQPDFDSRLEERKERFFKTDFVQSFPVVVLACHNYINKEEICSIFGVEHYKDVDEVRSKSGRRVFPFSIYYNAAHTKLVIHTCQLSGAIPNRLLEEIGNRIREFIHKN